MAKVKRILFAIELSELSEEIYQWANLMGQQFNAELHIVHVLPDLNEWALPYTVHPNLVEEQNRMIRNAEKKLDEYCSRNINSEIPYKRQVLVGKPAEQVVNYIQSEHISLVIIGTHGRSGMDRSLFGSVADRVLRFSPVPVLTINPHPMKIDA